MCADQWSNKVFTQLVLHKYLNIWNKHQQVEQKDYWSPEKGGTCLVVTCLLNRIINAVKLKEFYIQSKKATGN